MVDEIIKNDESEGKLETEAGWNLPNSPIALILLIIILNFSNADNTTAQTIGNSSLPDAIAQCTNVSSTSEVSTVDDLTFTPTVRSGYGSFLEAEPGIIELHWTAWIQEAPDHFPNDYNHAEAIQRSVPVISMFLEKAFSHIDGYEYRGIGLTPGMIYVTEADKSLIPIIRELTLGMPKGAAMLALNEMILTLESGIPDSEGRTIPASTQLRADDFRIVLEEIDDWVLPREMHESGIDMYPDNVNELIDDIDSHNWEFLEEIVPMPEKVWDFMKSHGFHVVILPISQLPEGRLGQVSGKKIIIGYDKNLTINNSVVIHELAHAINNLVIFHLHEYVEYGLDGEPKYQNLLPALANQIHRLLEDDYGKYPIFEDLVARVLYGNPIRNEEVKMIISNSTSGYRDMLKGQRHLISNPETLVRERFEGKSGGQRSVIVETHAMIYQRIWELCLFGDSDIVPPYILDLFSMDRIVEAIDRYEADQVEG